MSVTVPVVALAALVALSLVARDRKYHMTSASLMVLAGALAMWFVGLLFYSG